MSYRGPGRRLKIERFEDRRLLASDFLAGIEIDVLDDGGQPISTVPVGETFVLRVTAHDLRDASQASNIGVFASYADFTFDDDLVSLEGGLEFTDAFRNNRQFSVDADGSWDEVGAFLGGTSLDDLPSQSVVFEAKMRADAAGEVVFAANPADELPTGDFLLVGVNAAIPQEQIRYGFTRLQIGDSVAAPPSPWRNPGNPADVDGDGLVTASDVDLIEAQLHSSSSIVLADSDLAPNQAPFVDVDGNGLLDEHDALLTRAQIPSGSSDNPLDHLSDQEKIERFLGTELELSVEIVNVRTGSTEGELLVGDIVEVRIGHTTATAGSHARWAGVLFHLIGELTFDDQSFKRVTDAELSLEDIYQINYHGMQPVGRLQVLKPGESTLDYSLDFSGLHVQANIHELSFDALRELLAPKFDGLSRRVTAVANENRPEANGDFYDFQDLFQATTAMETAEAILSSGGSPIPHAHGIPISVQAAAGVLANDLASGNASLTAELVERPRNGTVILREDGSFDYSPHSIAAIQDQFQYVAISPDGVSEVRTVVIDGVHPPILDIEVRAVDETGQSLSSVSLGQEFFIEIATFSAASPNPYAITPLAFDVSFDRSLADPVGEPDVTDVFDRRFLDLGQDEDGKYSVERTLVSPSVDVGDGKISVSVPGFMLSGSTGRSIRILRQKMVASSVGNLDLDATLQSLRYYQANNYNTPVDADPRLVNMEVDQVAIRPGSVSQDPINPLDVNHDGSVTPVDVLLIVNRINRSSDFNSGSAGDDTFIPSLDTNRDGLHSPTDALLVINYLNRRADDEQAEGEAHETDQHLASAGWPADDLEQRRKKRLFPE